MNLFFGRLLRRILSLFLIFGLLSVISEERGYAEDRDDAIHIAFAGPLSGTGKTVGQSYTQGIELYLEEINTKGGIKGKKIVLDRFDDQNDNIKAIEAALEIAKQNKAVAIIGHWYSSCSISGGEIYKEYGIPAVSGSTNIRVTQNNKWTFRATFDDNLQGRFIANYVHKILKSDKVSIIYEDVIYGAYLAQVFEETLKASDVEIKYKRQFRTTDQNLDQTLQKIVDELKTIDNPGIIFLAAHSSEGVKLVRLIKDAGIKNLLIGPDDFSSQTFIEGFDSYPKEILNPGYYSNDIYVSAPLIFDTANAKAHRFREAYKLKYHEEPDWIAAYAYDSAMLIIEAIKKSAFQGTQTTLKEDRKKIRDYLAHIDAVSKAIEGTTGLIYFDEKRNSNRAISMGVYKNKNIVSALIQLQPIRQPHAIPDFEAEVADDCILLIDGKYMYKTNVVYTGIEINDISDPDFNKSIYKMDFFIWFRYQGDFNPQEIEFLNSAESVRLGSPLINETYDKIHYDLYQVKGSFKADFITDGYPIDKHILGISFRHRALTRNNLIYVTDILGMELKKWEPSSEKLKKTKVLSPRYGWEISRYWFFPDTSEKISLGNPKYIGLPGELVEYSRFNACILVEKSAFTLRRVLPFRKSCYLTIFSSVGFILLMIFGRMKISERYSKSLWFIRTAMLFGILVSAEAAIFPLIINTNAYRVQIMVMTFDILWWVISAILLNSALEHFLWVSIEKKSGYMIPKILRRFVAFIIYILAFFGIIAFVYDQKITSLLATSGVFAMVIGLAVQMNISNLFSGIAVNLERPFRIGDWIKIGSYEEGKVIDITWRTTRILTRFDNILSVPNRIASESVIWNYHYPTDVYRLSFPVQTDTEHQPEKLEKILSETLMTIDGISEYTIRFQGIVNKLAEYWITFSVKDYEKKDIYNNLVWKMVWTRLNEAGIIHRQ